MNGRVRKRKEEEEEFEVYIGVQHLQGGEGGRGGKRLCWRSKT